MRIHIEIKASRIISSWIKQQDKTKARLYHAMLEYYDANHKKKDI